MRFKFITGTLLLSVATLSGCSLYEGPSAPRRKEMKQGNLRCLKDVRAKFTEYFEGKASADDVNRIADCTISALRTFQVLTRGENRDRFTAVEVRNFLQHYFLDDVVFSDVLLKEIMRVKQALVGGKDTEFTGADIDEAEILINVFRKALLRLQPSMPLTLERVARENPAYADSAAQAVIDVGTILGTHITESDSIYSFEEMGRLCDEVVRTFKGSARAVDPIRDNLSISGIFKEMLISPDHPRNSVTAAEWQLLFKEGSRWAGLYIRMTNLRGQFPQWMRGEGRKQFTRLAEEGLDLLDTVINRHCPSYATKGDSRSACSVTPGIPIQLLQEAIEKVEWDGTLSGVKINKVSLQKVIAPLIRRILGGNDLSDGGRAATRLTQDHTARLRLMIQEWSDGARYLEGVFAAEKLGTTFSDNAVVRSEAFTASNAREIMRRSGNASATAVFTAETLKKSYSRTMALSAEDSESVVFDGENSTRPRVYRELSRYTWLKPFLRRGVLGYMTGPHTSSRALTTETDGLTEAEFTVLIRDFWPLLLDFKLVGPQNTPEGDAKNRFREASLFMQVSDGSNLISIDEGVQLVLYALSADNLAGEVHGRATKLCKNGEPDDYGGIALEPTCYRKTIYDISRSNPHALPIWKSFPLIVQFYEGLSAKKRAHFEAHLESASRKSDQVATDYLSSDATDATIMMFHYVEALFLRFDKNEDGLIDQTEADLAFPNFQAMLAEKSDMKPTDKKLKSIFNYLLAKGNPPFSDDQSRFRRFWGGGAFLFWHWGSQKFKADRLNLISVFATLSQTPAEPKK